MIWTPEKLSEEGRSPHARGRREWPRPRRERRVDLVGPASGAYRIQVRAARSDGAESPAAVVAFTVATPLWRRWWFGASLLALLAAAAAGMQRVRVARLLALARMSVRIAADLHDELGLSPTRISVLSALAGRRVVDADASGRLEEIGATARELVNAASDIVRALDPRHDDLASLLSRLRRFAADVFAERGTEWRFACAETGQLPLAPEQRRHIDLILKEAVNNPLAPVARRLTPMAGKPDQVAGKGCSGVRKGEKRRP